MSRPPNIPAGNTSVNQDINELQSWQLSGKIAWITPEERKSAYINWQTSNNDITFNLNNLLGVNLASLSTKNGVSTLSADDKTFFGDSASLLIFQQTGFRVPIEQLKHWVKGQIPNSENDYANIKKEITFRTDGLIKSLTHNCEYCDVWDITYNNYTQAEINQNTYILPSSIELFNPAHQARIKIRISGWSG